MPFKPKTLHIWKRDEVPKILTVSTEKVMERSTIISFMSHVYCFSTTSNFIMASYYLIKKERVNMLGSTDTVLLRKRFLYRKLTKQKYFYIRAFENH